MSSPDCVIEMSQIKTRTDDTESKLLAIKQKQDSSAQSVTRTTNSNFSLFKRRVKSTVQIITSIATILILFYAILSNLLSKQQDSGKAIEQSLQLLNTFSDSFEPRIGKLLENQWNQTRF